MKSIKLSLLAVALGVFSCTPPKGEIGPKGPQGAQGENGTNGTDGLVGDKGPAGDKGPVGPLGPAGAQGPSGELQAYYSGWKPLTFALESEENFAGTVTAKYSALFEEQTITQSVLERGTVMIFTDRRGDASSQIAILKSGVVSTYDFLDDSGEYLISAILNEAGKLKFSIEVESANEDAAAITQKIANENIYIQTYAVLPTN